MMPVPNSVLILLSRYQTMYSSSMPMNPSIETPAKLRLWKNSCLGRPKNPSAAALSGEQPFAPVERVRLLSVQMRIRSGCHYRWDEWIRICEEHGLIRSMSAKGCSPDNAAAEGFFGRLKNELFYGRDWRGVGYEEFRERLAAYLTHYNETRIKKSLDWMSPVQYRRSLGLAA